jgi:hypothetical protein
MMTEFNEQNALTYVTTRHHAEDDLFHFDRRTVQRSPEGTSGLFSSKISALCWVRGVRPRWLIEEPQPLLRPRNSD